MKLARLVGIVGIALSASYAAASTTGNVSRSDVADRVLAACSSSTVADCLSAVRTELARANSVACKPGVVDCVCAPSAIKTGQGIGDAVATINERDAALATRIAEQVALHGAECIQLSFAAIIDNPVAAIPPAPGSDG